MEDLLHSLVNSIVDRARDDGIDVTPTLALFVVKAVVIENPELFSRDHALEASSVEELMRIALVKLAEPDTPGMQTTRMQVGFETAFSDEDQRLRNEAENKQKKVISMLREITGSKAKASEALYRKMVSFMLLTSEYGQATDLDVVRETAAALESVFPQSELPAFVSLSLTEKQAQLSELSNIVCGIRLFNRDIGQGAGAKDVPQLEPRQSDAALLEHIEELVEKDEQIVDDYQAVIDDVHYNQAKVKVPISRLQDELTFRQQYLAYLRIIRDEMKSRERRLHELRTTMAGLMDSLRSIVKSRSAVPTEQVFPRFQEVASVWENIKDEYERFQSTRNLLLALQAFDSAVRSSLELDDITAGRSSQKKNQERSSSAASTKDDKLASVPESTATTSLLFADNVPNFDELPLELHGYCPVSAATREGLVLPGRREHGIIRYKDKHYATASAKAARAFFKDPEGILGQLIGIVSARPQLIDLMGLWDHFPSVTAINDSLGIKPVRQGGHALVLAPKATVTDAGVGTPTHFVESHIDPNYEWNEWEMRRKALKLVNLRTKKTHSAQTNQSHFRRDNETQHYEKREKPTQTQANSATNVAKKKTYVKGLRGNTKKEGMKVVTLTLDV